MSLSVVATGRQRRSIACDECRRRKLRCDGQQPQCGVCEGTGVVCEVTQRATRGPKRGHLTALKNRVMHLEALLESRVPAQDTQHGLRDLIGIHDTRNRIEQTPGPATSPTPDREEILSLGATPDSSSPSHQCPGLTPSTPSNAHFQPPTGVLQDELDQLYLDRVHQSIPILHQQRYLSWSKSIDRTPSRRCLQHAMWTLASLLSTQFRDNVDPLYEDTKRMLEHLTVDGSEDTSIGIELAQAWVLIVAFESMRTHHRRAWMSAGRAFRLVQALHYHQIDKPVDNQHAHSPQCVNFIEVEERRRVFWMAYFLDHIISMRDDWPVTLNEHVICTRLPAPDSEFQNGHQNLGPFLSEALTNPTLTVRSCFNECLILVTLCGRSLLQSQQYQISKAYGDTASNWSQQRLWLDSLLTSRLQVLSECYPSPTESYDPLLLFTSILAQATVIYFCKSMTDSISGATTPSGPNTYEQTVLQASTAIIQLATTLCQLPFTRVHPLMPMPLFLCAEFLYDNMHSGESFQLRLRELFHVFSELKNVNNHEQSYLDLLPQSCIAKTAQLLGHNVDKNSHASG